jgi:hypothetical protein
MLPRPYAVEHYQVARASRAWSDAVRHTSLPAEDTVIARWRADDARCDNIVARGIVRARRLVDISGH